MKKVQVGFLMSYDYEMLKNSIPPVYKAADEIFIALDKNYRTWSGGSFTVDESFFEWLKILDAEGKITIYKDDFYVPRLNAMENEVRERKMLASQMGIGNWLVQIDSDEYFLNFKKFVEELHSYNSFLEDPEKNQVQIAVFLVNLYKYVDNGVLHVKTVRRQKLATNFPDYRTGRNTKKRIIYTKNLVLHECISRDEKDVRTKLKNWGHSHQIDIEGFMEKWKKVDKSNFRDYKDFFYLKPKVWKELDFLEGSSIEDFHKNFDYPSMMPSDFFIWKKNFGQWFKSLLKWK